nr:reverse transcriptase domain-containing protein [Tanacetum cinerariifolium]
MSTHSSARNLFPPLDNPELTIRRRYRSDPTLLNSSKMAAEGPNNLPVPNLWTMEELCQPSLNGRSSPIAPIAIQPTNFGLKNDKIQQVQNSCQFHGLSGDDANKHLDKFLNLFPPLNNPELTIRRRSRTDPTLLNNSEMAAEGNVLTIQRRSRTDPTLLNDFEIAAEGNGDPPVPDLRTMKELCQPSLNGRGGPIAPISIQATNFRLQNDMIQQVHNSCQFHGLPGDDANKHLDKLLHVIQSIKPPLAKPKMYMLQEPIKVILTNLKFMKMNIPSSSGSGTLPGNTITNPKEELKSITTRSGTAYHGPMIPTTSSLPKVVERETEVTKDIVPPTNNGSTKDVQPPVVQTKTPILNSEHVVAPIIEPIVAPVSASKPNQKPSIPYTSRLHDQKLLDKANDQKEKIFKIFQDLNFNISFADALILMPKFGPTIKSLLTNKDKLFELARTPLNERCSAVLLKKLPKKLGDLGKFLIPCDFLGMDECLALADFGTCINLMPLSV